MKKIVFVMEQLYGGGAERVTAALMNEMCKSAEIHLLSTYQDDPAKYFPTDARVIMHMNKEKKGSRVRVVWGRLLFLRRMIAKLKPDCVVSLATPNTATLITAAMCGMKTPLVLSERNDPAQFPDSKVIRMFRLLNYFKCKGLVFQTHEAQAFFPKRIGKKSTIICNPLTGTLPERYEGNRERIIINCCRLVPQKNLDLLIDAFSDITPEFQDVSLEIYGEGPERTRLESKITKMDLTGRVLLRGYSDNIYSKMRTCAMFVSSSDYEGISNSMLEAIALGVPTVCTDCPVGGAREVIRNGENGFLVPTKDRSAMAEAMRRVLQDPELAERLSMNGSELRKEISVEAIAGKWMDYIDKICAG